MQLPNYNDPVLRLQREIKDLQEKVRILSAQARPTVPIYTPTHLADLIDQNPGEFWINSGDGKMYFRYNGNNKVTSLP